jgi:UDP-N-acetylglucosamine:LPS N-acetylglucosamine transferase
VLLITGGAAGARSLRGVVRAARAEQRQLCANVVVARRGRPAAKVAVDRLFFRRLVTILRM